MPADAPPVRVACPPQRPFVLYDGDCRLCWRWAGRWQQRWGPRLCVGPSQYGHVRFPEIPPERYAQALQLIDVDGVVYAGAEAALRARAYGRARRGWLLWSYQSVPGAAGLLEFGYRIVARNRRIFSMLIR